MSAPKPSENAVKEEVDLEAGENVNNELSGLTAQVMNNPEALAMMQSKLAGMVGNLSGYYDSLPVAVKKRVKALKNLQVESMKLEAQYHSEIHALECKYAKLYDPLFKKRSEIVNSKYEPTEEECDYPSDVEEDNEENEESPEKKDEEKKSEVKSDLDEDTKGIPEFWLTIFKNVEIIAENIQEQDEPILAHLTDVTVKLEDNPMGFTLEFHFSPNEYFSNEILSKYYELRNTPDEKDPFSYEGPEILKCKGCEINWNKGKNVTVKTIIKKQKHKSKGSVRTVPKTVPNDSFFNFFTPPDVPENEEDMDEDTQSLLSADFEIGEVIRQRLIPRAVLYFTGEALIDEEYEDDEEEEEDEEESDEDEDADYSPDKAKAAIKGKGGRGNKENPQECKQQ